MQISDKGKALIKSFESLHDGDLSIIGLQPKMCPAGVWTEGYGRAIVDPRTKKFVRGSASKGRAYELATVKTAADADRALDEDLDTFEWRVRSKLRVNVTQNQFDALVSHTYNTGGSDTLFRLINTGASREAIYNWFTTRYTTVEGKELPGLVRRRKAEADLFFS